MKYSGAVSLGDKEPLCHPDAEQGLTGEIAKRNQLKREGDSGLK